MSLGSNSNVALMIYDIHTSVIYIIGKKTFDGWTNDDIFVQVSPARRENDSLHFYGVSFSGDMMGGPQLSGHSI